MIEEFLYFFAGSFYGIFVFPLFLIGGVVVVILAVRHFRKAPSPKDSQEAFLGLRREMGEWRREGLVSSEQEKKIADKYIALAPRRRALKQKKTAGLFAIFGACLAGLGVILLIAANWASLPKPFLTALLIAFTLLAYVLAWLFKFKWGRPKIADALILLGSILYGSALIAITQLYNIRLEFSNLLLAWALPILPLAYFAKSTLSAVLSAALLGLWGLFSFPGYLFGFGEEPILPLRYYFSLILVLGLMTSLAYYRLKSLSLQGFALLFLIFWLFPIAILKWFKGTENIALDINYLFLALGIALFFLGELHLRLLTKFSKFKNLYFLIGLWLMFITCLVLTFPGVYNINRSYLYDGIKTTSSSFMPVFFSFVLFGLICFMAYLGIKREESSFTGLAIFFFVIFVLAKYFSLSWSLTSKSFLFMIGGALLFGASYLISLVSQGKLKLNRAEGINFYDKGKI